MFDKLNWKWVAMAGAAVVLIVAVLLTVALTDMDVTTAVGLVTGLVGVIGGLNGPKKSAEDASRARAKKAAKAGAAMIVLAALLATGCGASALTVHAQAADAMSTVTNATTGELETAYEQGQHAAVEDACGTTDPSAAAEPCRDEAQDGAEDVRERWEPVWESHELLEDLHERYRERLQTAAAGDIEDPLGWARLAARLVETYRALVEAAGAVDVRLPPVPPLLDKAAALAPGGGS